MQHMLNTMNADVSTKDDVWYVDSGACNHMTSRGEWFRDPKNPETPSYVEIGDIQLILLLTLGMCHCLCRIYQKCAIDWLAKA